MISNIIDAYFWRLHVKRRLSKDAWTQSMDGDKLM